jgi:hypothetical protein
MPPSCELASTPTRGMPLHLLPKVGPHGPRTLLICQPWTNAPKVGPKIQRTLLIYWARPEALLGIYLWEQLIASHLLNWPQPSPILPLPPEALPNSSSQTQLFTSLSSILPKKTTILLSLPEALVKFHWQMQLMTSFSLFLPLAPTTLPVTPEALAKFHGLLWVSSCSSHLHSYPLRSRRRRCPISTGTSN